MKKFLYIFLTYFVSSNALANQPKDWQLGFQEAASSTMRDIVNFHDKILLPIIIAISVFVLFLMVYACIRFRASRNPNPSKTTHNVAVEVLWTLIPCLILIVMAVPSFKILYKQDTIPKADVTVKAIGYQWYWGYEYPDENIIFESYMIETKDLKENQPRLLAVDNEVVVPVNKGSESFNYRQTMFCMLGHFHLLVLREMQFQEELMKHGLKLKKLELTMDNVLSFVELNMPLCQLL
jgi:cytochrome c oxidase subunit 2